MAQYSEVRAILAVIVFGALSARAVAQPEPWAYPDGTIHYYDAVAVPNGILRAAAQDSVSARGGYLATISSQNENDFVFGLIDSGRYWYQRPASGVLAGPWLGGFRTLGYSNPDSGWGWTDGESFSFRNWTPGEPDNLSGNALNFGEAMTRVGTWNSLSDTETSLRGYVGELSAARTTIGLIRNGDSSFPGYTLFSPLQSRMTYLIDNKGRLIHTWHSQYHPGLSVYLLENGDLLRTANVNNPFFGAGNGGRVERLDWDGSLLWSYTYSNSSVCQHHDVRSLPNGNVLMIAWEAKARAEAIAIGRDPSLISEGELWPDHLIEVNPTSGSIVWEWHVWDHLIQDFDPGKPSYGVVAQHSELVDLNYVPAGQAGKADWMHTNSVDYNADLDQVLISVHNFSEIWVIDHSTTSEQARGHTGGRQGMGGDILYRWGNPLTYDAGTVADRKLFVQHNARWIESGFPGAGHILIYNNGLQRPGGNYSTVDELVPPIDSAGHYPRPAPGTSFGPATVCWQYGATPASSMYSPNISGAQRLPNGNTLICVGASGSFREVTRDSQVVWRYINPVIDSAPLYQGDSALASQNNVFRITRYASDYPGLAGRDLTPGYPIEKYRFVPSGFAESGRSGLPGSLAVRIQPNPVVGASSISYSLPASGNVTLELFDAAGRQVRTLVHGYRRAGTYSLPLLFSSSLARGIYYCRLEAGDLRATRKLVRL
jgi:hypothetical protein